MQVVGLIIAWILQIYLYLLLARAILSFIPLLNPRFSPSGLVLVLFELVYSLTDPPLKLAKRLLPAGPSFGGVRLDIGFLVVWLGVILLMRLNSFVFFNLLSGA